MGFYKVKRFIFLTFVAIIALLAISDLPVAKAFNGVETQITNGSNNKGSPAIYGNRIVWVENDANGSYWNNVFLYDISKGQISQITKESYTNKFNLKIYGDNIVWSEHEYNDYGPVGLGIYTYNIPSDDVSSGVKKRIADIGSMWGVYGLDIYGDKIVWAARSGNGYSNVYFYDISSGQTTPIATASDTYATSRYSPAIYENKIVYYCTNENGVRSVVCLYDISLNKETVIDFDASRWFSGYLDIYKNRIIGSTGNIFWYDYSTMENRFFAGSDSVLNITPIISLSGDKIVWLGYFDGKYKIYSYDISTGEKFIITDEENIVYPTPMAFDQDNIVWVDTKDGNQNIYRYKYFPVQASPILYQQSDKSIGSSCFFNKVPYCWGYQVLGKGLSGKLKSITVNALIESNPAGFSAYLYDYTANNQYYAGFYSSYYEHKNNPNWLGDPITGEQADYTFEFLDEPVLDPTHSYQIRFSYGSYDSGLQIFGSSNFDSYPNGSWYNYDTEGIKNAYFVLNMAEPPQPQNPTALSYSLESGYVFDGISGKDGGNDGFIGTDFTFKVVYSNENNIAPQFINVIVSHEAIKFSWPMILDEKAYYILNDGDYTNSEQYVFISPFLFGKYYYHFETSDGSKTMVLPEIEDLSFEVKNRLPVALFEYIPENPKAGQEITFDASSSYDLDGEIIRYMWDWDDDGQADEYTGDPIIKNKWLMKGLYNRPVA